MHEGARGASHGTALNVVNADSGYVHDVHLQGSGFNSRAVGGRIGAGSRDGPSWIPPFTSASCLRTTFGTGTIA